MDKSELLLDGGVGLGSQYSVIYDMNRTGFLGDIQEAFRFFFDNVNSKDFYTVKVVAECGGVVKTLVEWGQRVRIQVLLKFKFDRKGDTIDWSMGLVQWNKGDWLYWMGIHEYRNR